MRVIEDDGEGLDLEIFAQADIARKVVDDDGRTVLRLGAVRMSLLGKDLYVWMVPGPGLAPIRARELRDMWRKAVGDRTVVVSVNSLNKKAARWVKFFGFRFWKSTNGEDFYVIHSPRAQYP